MALCLGSVPRDLKRPPVSKPPILSNPPKRKATSDLSYMPKTVLSDHRPLSNKRSRPRQDMSYMELHHSTCLNFNSADSSDSDLWILPDFEDWEYDDASPAAHTANKKFTFKVKGKGDEQDKAVARQNEWAPLVQRAVSSNRERLRLRLECDGWHFVGGKYAIEEEWKTGPINEVKESVDDEFDFVILLPWVAVS